MYKKHSQGKVSLLFYLNVWEIYSISSVAGVSWDDDRLIKLAKDASNYSNIDFRGLYSHDGNSYTISKGRNTANEELGQWGQTASSRMLSAKKV